MFQRWLFWPLFAALIGFVVGGSLVWGIDHPNNQQHESHSNPAADAKADQDQPSKPFGKALSIIWDRTWDDPVAFYTFVLAIFTALLAAVASVQIFFLIRADKTARISAEAAQAAAKAFQIAERPYIFIWGVIGYPPKPIIQNDASFVYSISNRGKLTAVIERVSISCGYEMNDRYPPEIIIGDHRLLSEPIVSPESDVPNLSHPVHWSELDLTGQGPEFRNGLIFRVIVYYRGPFSRGHKTSQCWRYVKSRKAFAEVTDEQYTYSR